MQNDGAGFLSGAAGGFFGSLGATAWGGAGGKWKGIGGDFGRSSVGTIAFGALSGGVGAELSGGNFWQGAIAGGIVSGLNHVMHMMSDDGGIDPPMKGAKDSKVTVIGPETPIQNPDGSPNTRAYNCHSYAWEGSMGDPSDPSNSYLVSNGITKWDNNSANNKGGYHKIPFSASNKVGDRVVYYAWDAKMGRAKATHSAVVTKVNSSGQAIQLTSKFGQGPLATHHPRNIPSSYGSPNPTFVAPNGNTYPSRIYYRKN